MADRDEAAFAPVARMRAALAAGPRRRRMAVALAAGALSALALPPFHLVPVLAPSFVALAWLLEGATGRRGVFGWAWLFGLGHFAAGLYWIYHAFMVQAEQHAWLAPIMVGGLAALMAAFPAATLAAARGLGGRGPARIIVLAAAWTASEWLRSWVLTGFPWNLIGTVWVFSDAMIQPAAWFGAYGLGFVTVAAAAAPAVLADAGMGRRRAIAWSLAPLLALGLCGGAGVARLAGASDAAVEGVRLRLVQPNIPQDQKWRRDLRVGHVERQIHLSQLNSDVAESDRPTHVIWAETAVPFVVETGRPGRLLAMLALAAPPGGLAIVGAPRSDEKGEALWNSLIAIDREGRVAATFDKAHLVPFGEYVPFRGLLDFARLAQARSDFSAGPGPRTLRLPGLPPVSPLICYEVIFPGAVARTGVERPGWLLNLTNDGWFGISPGPWQHFATARLRAVEEGLPLVRVANTGVSGVVDAWGRVWARLELGRDGVLDARLPAALEAETPFGRFGVATTALLLTIACVGALVIDRARPMHPRGN